MYIYSTETHTIAFARSVTLGMVHINNFPQNRLKRCLYIYIYICERSNK